MKSNKELAVELFERFNESDIDGVLGMLAEDATWLVPGRASAFANDPVAVTLVRLP